VLTNATADDANDSRAMSDERAPRDEASLPIEGQQRPSNTTVIIVTFRTEHLELEWIPPDARIVIVHNDDALDPATVTHPGARHVLSGANVGFGAGVNKGLNYVETERVLLVNPDTELRAEHWSALTSATMSEVVAIALVDQHGHFGGSANPYPTPFTLACTAWKVGRLLPRHGVVRRGIARLSQATGGGSLAIGVHHATGTWPLRQRWPSGAVVSYPTDAVRSVGGFDERFFLYAEDIDLASRLAAHHGTLVLRVADVTPGFHAVGGSRGAVGSTGAGDAGVHEVRSLHRYGADRPGWRWRLCTAVIGWRLRLLTRGES
jgi:GT2 family glycosyltransferase